VTVEEILNSAASLPFFAQSVFIQVSSKIPHHGSILQFHQKYFQDRNSYAIPTAVCKELDVQAVLFPINSSQQTARFS